ncbi:hypothetical protein D3C71_1635590 [compost metagenome]
MKGVCQLQRLFGDLLEETFGLDAQPGAIRLRHLPDQQQQLVRLLPYGVSRGQQKLIGLQIMDDIRRIHHIDAFDLAVQPQFTGPDPDVPVDGELQQLF